MYKLFKEANVVTFINYFIYNNLCDIEQQD